MQVEKIRYYLVGEYGTKKDRPHYHAIVFNVRNDLVDEISNRWGLGHIMCGTVTPASIHYVAKYHVNVISPEDLNGRDPPFALMSRKPGIGSRYFETHTEWHIYADRLYSHVDGYKIPLPRYYRVKMFAERVIEMVEINERELYEKEIERLKEFHDEPHYYYSERRRYNHDAIIHKSNENNSL